MNICIVTPEIGSFKGGIATFYNSLIPVLNTAGNSIIILTVDRFCNCDEEDSLVEHSGYVEIILKKTYYDCYKLYEKRSSKDALHIASEIAFAQSSRIWVENNYEKYKIDVIETVDANGLGYFLVAPKLPAVVICGHGALFQLSKYDFVPRDKRYETIIQFEKKSLSNADLIITHSLLNQDRLSVDLSLTVNFTTPPAPEQIEFSNNSLNNNENHFDFVVVGRLQTVKGIEILAKALDAAEKRKIDLRVLWIGNDTYTAQWGSLWSKFLKRNYKNIWNKKLIWREAVSREEIKQIIGSARVIIIPSLWETFSYVALEAALANKQIIVTEATGAVFLIKDYANSRIIPAGDPAPLLEAMLYFKDNKSGDIYKKVLANDLLPRQKVLQDRMKCYNMAIEIRKKRKVLDYYARFHPGRIDLKLGHFYFCKKQFLKILSLLRIKQKR